MGHFSYTCHLSGLPITGGTKAVLLPLIPKTHWSYDNSQTTLAKYGKANLCSNDGANMFFDELCFPIFGEYDSYGRLENIEKDDNTKVLEEFFGLSIEDIVTVITDGRKDEFEKGGQFCDSVKILDKNNEKHMKLLSISATWYHRGVFEKLSKIDSKDHFDRVDLGTHGILDTLGFKLIGTDKSVERYNKVYEKDGLKIHSDGTWINIPKESIYDIWEFKKYCSKKGVEINEKLVKGSRYSQIYDFKLAYDNTILDFAKDRDATYILLGDEYSVSSHSWEFYDALVSEGLLSEDKKEEIKKLHEETINKNLTLFYFRKIKEIGNDFLKQNIVDWFNVKQYYYSTGRFLYPVVTSDQDGNHKNVQILLSTALDVLTEEMKDMEFYDDEENEDEN